MSNEYEEPTITTGGERLSIFEIMQRFRNDGSCKHVIEDALRRLSSPDSEAAELDLLRRASVNPEDRQYGNTVYNAEGNYTLLAQNAVNRAATRMRDKCLELVHGFDGWVACRCSECKLDGRAHAVDVHASLSNLATEIQSTLDNVEQEK